ncbi:MAG: response regulator, partial [Chloroflexota bacterium]
QIVRFVTPLRKRLIPRCLIELRQHFPASFPIESSLQHDGDQWMPSGHDFHPFPSGDSDERSPEMARILIIEDNSLLRDDIAQTLEYEGYSVLTAANGIIGVASALSALPDLILCDVRMPELDGYGVLKVLRAQPTTNTIPFIFLTAKAARMDVRQGMELGADDYLTKPHTAAELLAAVRTRLEKRTSSERKYQQSFDELRGNLVRMLPHELRTPLIGIMGFADIMKSDADNLDPKDIREMGEVIATEAERLHHGIENHLLYARIELASYDTVQMEALAQQRVEMPGAAIREVARMKARKFERMNDLTVEAEDVEICISAASLWKIVEELVDNALKFSKPGTPIQIKGLRESEVYLLQVSDQGRGMTPDQIQHVGLYMQFERKEHEQQGMGMGLILAQRLAQLSAGGLSIVSESGRGTTVSVEFPVAL